MATKLFEELELIYAAMATVRGIVVQTEDVRVAIPRFYQARREAEDPSLMQLNFRRSPYSAGEFMIVKIAQRPQAKVSKNEDPV